MEDLMRWAWAGIKAALPSQAVQEHLICTEDGLHFAEQQYGALERGVWLLCAGKAAIAMAQGFLQSLPISPRRTLVITREGQAEPLSGCTVVESGHPLNNAASNQAGHQALACAREAGAAGGLLLCGLSGGASALLAAPYPDMSIAEIQDLNRALLASGADISAINALRRRCLQCAGGGLAQAALGARVWAMVVSDVPGDRLADIASGPLCPDPTWSLSAQELAERAGIVLPAALAAKMDPPRSQSTESNIFEHIHQRIIAGNQQALDAIAAAAHPRPVLRFPALTGEAALAAQNFAQQALAMPAESLGLSGGETTVTLSAQPGRGGRNQEFALAAARLISGHPSLRILALGSDGSDGPTDAAGGLVDGSSWPRLCAAWGKDAAEAALREHNAYPALDAVGALIRTGPTQTNVADLALAYHSDCSALS